MPKKRTKPPANKPKPPQAEPGESPRSSSPADKPMAGTSLANLGVGRIISLLVLLAVVVVIGVQFFRVMASFLVPLFLAAVMAVVFKPLHEWCLSRLPRRPRLAALLTTVLISLSVIVPSVWLGWKAFAETKEVLLLIGNEEHVEALQRRFQDRFGELAEKYAGQVEAESISDTGIDAAKYVSGWVLKLGLDSVQALFAFCLGSGILVFALYYFFADGPAIIEQMMHLSPLDDDYEHVLLRDFAAMSRAVVVATLLTAFIQGALAGVGYYAVTLFHADPAAESNASVTRAEAPDQTDQRENIELPVFLLTVVTMLMSIVPFLGAMAVWAPVAAWVMFLVPGGYWPGLVLAIYGFTIVSSVDNLLKPYILSGQANLHPLLALLSVLGGIQVLGPIGFIVGPMIVALLQSVLKMLRDELDSLHTEPAATG